MLIYGATGEKVSVVARPAPASPERVYVKRVVGRPTFMPGASGRHLRTGAELRPGVRNR
jgi:hypothetical protein